MPFFRIVLSGLITLASSSVLLAKSYELSSPNGKVKITISFDQPSGVLSYKATSGNTPIFATSPVGITTDQVDFSSGLKLVKGKSARINETYTLPQGKVSTYHNRANEKSFFVVKAGQKLKIIFRAYDEGIAFRYELPGSGPVEILREASGFNLADLPVFWGQKHPNNHGYESVLNKMDTGNAFSLALLCEMKEAKHWVLLAQAGTYGSYCIPHLTRVDATPQLLNFTFPIDQKEPIKTTLPFKSPWRVAVFSPNDLSTLVEQTLFENLNPPTDPALQNASWIKPGRTSWDWFAKDKKNWKGWIDFCAEMGWEYHLVDDGWERYITDPAAVKKYADSKGIGVMAWQSTPSMGTPEKVEAILKKYSELGFKGAKVDFFDRLPKGRTGPDYEDTQMGIQVRDTISQLAIKYKMQIVFHGCAIPTGERRRWPHLLGTEAVKGQEGSPTAEHDNCIAYIRNPLGPTDYSPVWFGKGKKTDAYQLATSIVFESGFLIFADLHKDYLNHPAKDFLKKLPSTWDEVRFIDGYPLSHTLIARRKGTRWFVAGITSKQKTLDLSFDFLKPNTLYSATLFTDQSQGLSSTRETQTLSQKDSIQIETLDRGGFAILLEPKK